MSGKKGMKMSFRTKEHCKQLSICKKGEKNPMYKKHTWNYKLHGEEYLSHFKGPVWNKGLTKKMDNRLKRIGEKNSLKNKGKPSKFKNKTFEERYGVEKAKEMKKNMRKLSLELINKKGNIEELRKRISLARKFITPESRKRAGEKISLLKIGELNANWCGGKSFEPYAINFNNKFKRMIRRRDNHVCMLCGVHQEKLNYALSIHHINYDKKLTIPENCVSLCNFCHGKTNKDKEIWKNLFQDKLSRLYGYQYENGNVIINYEQEQLHLR